MNGSGPGAWSIPALGQEIPKILELLVKGVGEYDIKERKLEDAKAAFEDAAGHDYQTRVALYPTGISHSMHTTTRRRH